MSRQHLKRVRTEPVLEALAEAGLNLFYGDDVARFAEGIKLSGSSSDPNATPWHEVPGHPPPLLQLDTPLSGLWSTRWNEGNPPVSGWTTGVAAAAFYANRFAILHKDPVHDILLLGEQSGSRLAGREYRAENLRDSGPWAGLIVAQDRIDGVWARGRWDFRR